MQKLKKPHYDLKLLCINISPHIDVCNGDRMPYGNYANREINNHDKDKDKDDDHYRSDDDKYADD